MLQADLLRQLDPAQPLLLRGGGGSLDRAQPRGLHGVGGA
jgi:hypothetical protein